MVLPEPPTPDLCPLCGQPNRCAMNNAAKPADITCWCFSLEIPAERLQRIPEAARNRACLCPRCAGTVEQIV